MTVSAPVRDLLQLALGSFPRSQEENDRSRALLRCAYRGRTRKVRLSIVENCGGPGSGKPGPCPEPDKEDQGSKSNMAKISNQHYQADFEHNGQKFTVNIFNVPVYDEYPGERSWGVVFGIGARDQALLEMSRTGKAGAAAIGIFRKVGLAVDDFIKQESPARLHFSAEKISPSRVRLYDRLAPMLAERHGYDLEVKSDNIENLYFLNKRKGVTGNQSLQDYSDWFNAVFNARPLKTDIRIKELAPYLHDLLGDVTKRDARAIARIVKRGVERRWKDSSVARAIVRSTKIEPDRAKVIARTEMSRARTDVGLGKKRDSDKVVFTLGAVDRTCPRCRALEGKVYTVRKAAGVIPVHPNCVLPGNFVECPDLVAASKSFYDGPAIEITLLNGSILTVTENHPILTPTGFLAAKHIAKGSQVLYATRSKRITKSINPNYDAGPTAIEEVFESFSMSGGVSSSRMPVSSEDFHGDARFFDGEIDVVHADGLLGSYSESFISKSVDKELFSDVGFSHSFNADGAFCKVCESSFASSNSVMGRASNGPTVLSTGFLHSHLRGGRSTTNFHAHCQQPSSQSPPRHTEQSRYFKKRFSSFIAATDVVKVKRFGYQGHVYDLQADVFELYICNGVIVKNCRCFWSDAPKGARVSNVFCATGEGGGVDPSCSKEESRWVEGNDDSTPTPGFQVLKDADGSPKTLYHGSKKNFDEFKAGLLSGFWLTEDYDSADFYTTTDTRYATPFDGEMPAELSDEIDRSTTRTIYRVHAYVRKTANDAEWRAATLEAAKKLKKGDPEYLAETNGVELLRARGYDSVRYDDLGGETVIVFDPNNVKILAKKRLPPIR